ncbi:septation protein A [Litoribrevibacter albus]|uniref:Inner membrane-spanning protein YciB n=1 Tax=Litoribrevibacter albus TaxID=1473156 RepID=A0AA37W705_9GAMM|nr:septation protein A [Litoribrevibacter albus]GLQ30778.1 putative intracellular septation protein A [Litoribrevibacter albus]
MKFLIDFFPIAIFFAVYKYTNDIILATAILIPSTALQILYTWVKHRKVEKMHIFGFALVLIMGGLTIALNDKTFIQWKPTLLNWLFAVAFLGSQFIGKRTIIEMMMSGNIELPANVWKNLNLSWVCFFIVAGAANIYVAYNFSEDAWVNFKLFGLLGMTFVFVIIQGIYMAQHMKDDKEITGKEINVDKAE